ncbi:MAG: amidase [Alphaproteobacteria bacterium]|nr:amidase [Alphaproteobacteria bacterium]
MTDVAFRSATTLAAEIRAKTIGCRELLELYLGRVERLNPPLNAIIATDIPSARQRADAADAALKRGEIAGPLHGVPMTVKESFDAIGMPTTWGLPELKDNIPSRDSLAVERFRRAGAVLFGKTNVPVLLADWQSYNPVYGTTNNPWDVTRSPGGSSGGSAAALAAGLTGLEAGSDIGASIRNPAHYCGVYGHKPTYGICPPRGQALPGNVAASDISVIGPMARSADDLALGLGVMAGPDPIEAAGWQLTLKPPRWTGFKGLRVGVMLSDPQSEVDQAVQAELQALADFLAKQGATVSDTARPALDTAAVQRLYVQMLRAATSGRQTDAVFAKNLQAARDLAPGDESYFARMTRANVLPHREWLAGNEQRHRMRLVWAAFFEQWDLLLCPAAASAACPHDQVGERHERTIVVNNKRVPTTDQLFWAGYSGLFFLPSTVAPIGQTADKLPVGVQIIGPQYGDLACIALAQLLEREYAGFVAPPGY